MLYRVFAVDQWLEFALWTSQAGALYIPGYDCCCAGQAKLAVQRRAHSVAGQRGLPHGWFPWPAPLTPGPHPALLPPSGPPTRQLLSPQAPAADHHLSPKPAVHACTAHNQARTARTHPRAHPQHPPTCACTPARAPPQHLLPQPGQQQALLRVRPRQCGHGPKGLHGGRPRGSCAGEGGEGSACRQAWVGGCMGRERASLQASGRVGALRLQQCVHSCGGCALKGDDGACRRGQGGRCNVLGSAGCCGVGPSVHML